MAKQWPPRHKLKGGIRSPSGSFGVVGGGGSGGVIPGQLDVELTTNGVFAADTDWTKDAGWTIAAGVATAAATAAAAYLHQAVTIVAGRTYRIVYQITAYTSGNIAWSVTSGQTGTTRSSTGLFTEDFVLGSASAELRFGRVSVDFTGSIDNVSLKQVG